ncbi:MAG: hypothetical protein COB69_00370 [Phycisphaera sp.]|nr:MAG: hypothetical protein COB69_00370 [Phycisphaera sp.]
MKMYLILGVLAVISLTSFFAGHKIASGACAKKQVKAMESVIKDSNEDRIVIAEKSKEIKTTKVRATREIIKIQKVFINDCPLNDIAELHNETYTKYPADLFVH